MPKDVLEKNILPLIPAGRLGEPEEIARCVVFLASDDAGFITGSTLSANGGQYMIKRNPDERRGRRWTSDCLLTTRAAGARPRVRRGGRASARGRDDRTSSILGTSSKALDRSGFIGMTIPDPLRRQGRPFLDAVLVIEEMAKCSTVGAHLVETNMGASRPSCTTAARRRRNSPPLSFSPVTSRPSASPSLEPADARR